MAPLLQHAHGATRINTSAMYECDATLLYKHQLWAGRLIGVLLKVIVWTWACHFSPLGPDFLTLWIIQLDGNPKHQIGGRWTELINKDALHGWMGRVFPGLELLLNPSYFLTCQPPGRPASLSGIGFVIPPPEWHFQTSPARTLPRLLGHQANFQTRILSCMVMWERASV